MDKQWFTEQARKAGVTTDDLAGAISRDRAVVSRILNGHQKIKPEQAEAFAATLKLPLEEILKHAGMFSSSAAETAISGFSEGDAAPWKPTSSKTSKVTEIAKALGAAPGVDVWQVSSSALVLLGYRKGDYILVDTNASELAKQGDIVIAQAYDWQSDSASTLLRRYEPPVLVAASPTPEEMPARVVDRSNVFISGVVTASWRL